MRSTIVVLAAILVLSNGVFADIARPDKTPNRVAKPASIETTLDIRLDANAKEAKLIIPRSQIKQLRAELEQLDDGNTAATQYSPGAGTSNLQTIMSGVFLSLALVFGGLWFFRTGRSPLLSSKTAAGLAIFGIAGFAATFAYANAGPPTEMRSITSKMFAQSLQIYGFAWGKIKLEVSDSDDRPRLIVPHTKASPTTSGE